MQIFQGILIFQQCLRQDISVTQKKSDSGSVNIALILFYV